MNLPVTLGALELMPLQKPRGVQIRLNFMEASRVYLMMKVQSSLHPLHRMRRFRGLPSKLVPPLVLPRSLK